MRQMSARHKVTEPYRYDYGGGTLQSGNFAAPIEILHGVDGNPRRHIITPPFDCWMEFRFHTIVINVGADWGRIDTYVSISPTPPVLSGQASLSTFGRDVKYTHPSTGWVGLESNTTVALTKGVTYTAAASIIPSTQTWNYYRGEFSWFERGQMIPRLTS